MNLKRPNTDLAPPQRNDPRVRHSRPLKPRAFLSWGCQRYFIRTFLRQWFSHHFLCSVINMCPCCNFSRDRCLMLLGKSDETRLSSKGNTAQHTRIFVYKICSEFCITVHGDQSIQSNSRDIKIQYYSSSHHSCITILSRNLTLLILEIKRHHQTINVIDRFLKCFILNRVKDPDFQNRRSLRMKRRRLRWHWGPR